MKKLLKLFCVFSVLICSFFAFMGCDETPVLKSINLYFDESVEYSQGVYNLVIGDTKELTVEINPLTYYANNLTWLSNTDVITVSCINNKVVVTTVGLGTSKITASYTNANGNLVSKSINVRVNDLTKQISFFNWQTSQTTYDGQSKKNMIKADQDNGEGIYSYKFISYNNNDFVEDIVDAGRYKVICYLTENEQINESKDFEITKKTLNLTAGSFDYIYGNGKKNEDLENNNFWPASLFNANNQQLQDISSIESALDLQDVELGKTIGKYVYTVDATEKSNVGSYSTNIVFEISDNYKRNYNVQANITKGKLNILKRDIVIKIKDATLTYGEKILPDNSSYIIYDYMGEDDLEYEGQGLTNEVVNYNNNIILGNQFYYLNEQTKLVNSIGCLDANDNKYILKYNNLQINNNQNLNLKKIIDGNIKVDKRQVSIEVNVNQSKNFLTSDPKINYRVVSQKGFLDDVNPFLFVNYTTVGTSTEEPIQSEYKDNTFAEVGEYNYILNNDVNSNYDITCENITGETLVKFTVNACPISFSFKDCVYQYKIASGDSHTISYYDLSNQDYKIEFSSFVINGINFFSEGEFLDEIKLEQDGKVVVKLDNDFSNNGFINFYDSTENSINPKCQIKINIKLGESENENYYLSYFANNYEIIENKNSGLVDTVKDFNIVSYNNPTLNLTKINIVVKPNEDALIKIFDGTKNLPENFGTNSDESIYYTIEENASNITSLSQILNIDKDKNILKVDSEGIFEVKNNFYSIELKDILELDYQASCQYYNIVLDTSKPYFLKVKPCEITITPIENQSVVYASTTYTKNNYPIKYIASNFPSSFDLDGNSINSDNLNETICGNLYIANKGYLSFGSNKNVGEYEISLGSLDFGDNYSLQIASGVKFEIEQRKVSITPKTYTIVYGDKYPAKIAYDEEINDDDFDESLAEKLEYIGEFALWVNDKVDGEYYLQATKVGSYYLAGNYAICQGTFNCKNSNFIVEFVEDSKFIVEELQINLDIISKAKQPTDDLSQTILDTSSYVLSKIILDEGYTATTTLTFNEGFLVPDTTNSIYSLKTDGDAPYYNLRIQVSKDGEDPVDVSNCYDIKIGSKVIYTINTTIINLNIVNKNDSSINFYDKVYSGVEIENSYIDNDEFEFNVVSCTDNNEVFSVCVDEVNHTSLNFNYKKSTATFSNNILNVGSYIVNADLSEGNFIVLKNNINEYIKFVFDSGSSVSNFGYKYNNSSEAEDKFDIPTTYKISLSNFAYLNITKADVDYNLDNISFENDLQYGSALPSNIKLEYLDEETLTCVFSGKAGEEIKFKTYSIGGIDLNYKFTTSQYAYKFATLTAGTTLNVSITMHPIVEKEGEYTENYNDIVINVPLKVIPQNIDYTEIKSISDSNFSLTYNDKIIAFSSKLYNGDNVINNEAIQFSNDFYRLETVFEDDVKPIICYYEYTDSILGSVINQIKLDNLLEADSYELKNINGQTYLVVGDKACKISSDTSRMSIKPGAYIQISNCNVDSNYILNKTTDLGFEQKRKDSIAYLYEIKKIGDDIITINNWTNEFNYGTAFDFNNPENLPFSFEITPYMLKDLISFKLSGENSPIYLQAGNYSVNLKINEENYYFNKTQQFKIVKGIANIHIPEVNVFKYNGIENTTYFGDIYASIFNIANDTLTNVKSYYNDNTNLFDLTFYYVFNDVEYEFVYNNDTDSYEINANKKNELETSINNNNFNIDELKFKVAPKTAGNYKLKITYGSDTDSDSNFYGSAVYNYTIEQVEFSQTIKFSEATINYDYDLLTTYEVSSKIEALIKLILGKMFTCSDLTQISTIALYYGNNKIGSCTIKEGQLIIDEKANDDEELFNSIYKYDNAGKSITIEVEFNNFNTKTWKRTKTLKISKNTKEKKILYNVSFDSSSEYSYSGYGISKYLIFNNIPLIPFEYTDETYIKGKLNVDNTEGTLDFENKSYSKKVDNYFITSSKYNKVSVKDSLGNIIFSVNYSFKKDGNPISYIPSAVGNYSISYIIEIGDNYNIEQKSFSDQSYSINKIELEINFNGSYNMKDKTLSSYINFLKTDGLNVKASEAFENCKFTIKFDSDFSIGDTDGIVLVLSLTRDESSMENLTNNTNLQFGDKITLRVVNSQEEYFTSDGNLTQTTIL